MDQFRRVNLVKEVGMPAAEAWIFMRFELSGTAGADNQERGGNFKSVSYLHEASLGQATHELI